MLSEVAMKLNEKSEVEHNLNLRCLVKSWSDYVFVSTLFANSKCPFSSQPRPFWKLFSFHIYSARKEMIWMIIGNGVRKMER